MKRLKIFNIPFIKLPLSKHLFSYNIKDSFFNSFNNSPVHKGNLNVKLIFDKQQENLFILNFSIVGFVNVECDKCLEYFDLPIKNEQKIIVKLSSKNHVTSDDILIIPRTESEIHVAQLIYEFIILAIPLRHVHPSDENIDGGCNPKALEIINMYSIESNSKKTMEIDQRWDPLKEINIS